MEINPTKKYRRRLDELKQLSQSWRQHWKEISEYMLPRKSRYLTTDTDDINEDGAVKNQKIINGVATKALRTVAAGMQGGLTSPARPWFLLTLSDKNMVEASPAIKEWLHEVRDMMLHIYAQSNFYNSVHAMYKELTAFGVSAMLIEEDFETIIRCRPFTIGEFYLATDARQRPVTLYTQFSMSAAQMEEEFGLENVSQPVKDALNNDQPERRFEIVHCIQPNTKFNATQRSENKKFESVFFEYNTEEFKLLRKKGYDSIPFVAPRWDVTGSNVYGDSPGMDVLGDVKQLQRMEADKLKAMNKTVDPPMNAPAAMRKEGGTIISGGVNYVPPNVQGTLQGLSPVYQINPDIQKIVFGIQEVEAHIKNQLFNDLFLSIIGQDKRMTATEVQYRQEEKLLLLGPVLERLQGEMLKIIIERTFTIMDNLGILPPPPPEIEGYDIKIEYISMLARAQKAVGMTSIEQTAAFVGNLAGVQPDVIDKLDFDEAIEQYADMAGVPPKIIRSDDEVEQLRLIRQQQLQQQQALQQGPEMAQSAKVLSEANVGNNNILESLLGMQQQT